ncbi:MAG: 4Fe-4S binding protein [Chloroflexi bacterium]|nr:4Fe-4S binding protein [Chloroflexota bacterium]
MKDLVEKKAANEVETEEGSITIEIVYRGIFQKTLAQRIARSIVLAARKRGHTGTAFGRYGDSPERNGVPAKYFAVVAINELELESSMAKYEPAVVDVSIVVDDTLVKGVESWAWYGRQPIWKPVRSDGFVVVTSEKTPDEVLAQTDAAERPYTLAVVPGLASFAGLWVFKDDHTDYRVLGALARLVPDWVRLEDVQALIREQTKEGSAADSAQHGFDATVVRAVAPGEGTSGHEVLQFDKPGWTTMRPGIIVDARKPGERNPYYKKYGARTLRPVVNFDTCIKCTMCWLDCPDECFEVTAEGHYEVVYEACIGCGICAAVCPVKDCIVMVDEMKFTDNKDTWALWKSDHDAYNRWFEEMAGVPADPKGVAARAADAPVGTPTVSHDAASGGDD